MSPPREVTEAQQTVTPLLALPASVPDGAARALRRAVGQLDGCLVATNGEALARGVASATSSFQACLRELQDAGRDDLATRLVAEALGQLFPLSQRLGVATAAGTPARSASARSTPARDPAAYATLAQDRRGPAGDALGRWIERLAELCTQRAKRVADGVVSWQTLERLDTALGQHVSAARLAGGMTEAICELAKTTPTPTRILATLALGCAPDDPELDLDAFEAATRRPDMSRAALMTLLRLRRGPATTAALKAALQARLDQPSPFRAEAVSILAGDGALTADDLAALIEDAEEPVACRAAVALAWGGDRRQARALLAHARRSAPERECALLLAAAALGCADAVVDARRHVEDGWAAPALFAALVVGGDESDVTRLSRHARGSGATAAAAVLAIAALGAPGGLDVVRSKDRELHADTAAAAVVALAGVPTALAARAFSGRQVRGKPWTVDAALSDTNAPETPVGLRALRALDVVARTGARPGFAYDAAAPAHEQKQAALRLHQSLSRCARAPTPGTWWTRHDPSEPA